MGDVYSRQVSYQVKFRQCGDMRHLVRGSIAPQPVAQVAYQIVLEPGIGQFREFESPRVHVRINSWGLFLPHKLTCGKRESVS